MLLFVHRRALIILIGAALVLAACEGETGAPNSRPTWTPRANSALNPGAPLPDETSAAMPRSSAVTGGAIYSGTPPLLLTQTTPQPLNPSAPQTVIATLAAGAAPRAAAAIPPVEAAQPFLPKFGPFPPVPIPNRPANLNPLTGLAADPAMLQRRPLVARIGNEQIVRTSNWHAGLSQADIVFEELIDSLNNAYANTRFSAVFLSQDPALMGPIRSGRIINFQMVPMVNGALVFSGGSNGTRWLFEQSPMINLDEYYNQPAYCYDKNRGYQGRLLTTAPRIREWLRQKGWEAPVPLYGFTFSDRSPGGQPVTSISLSKAPWPPSAQATWNYDSASGKYLRVSVGKPHIDAIHSITAKWGNGADCVTTGTDTQTQISAANVVVLYARHEKTNIIEDQNNAVAVYIPLTGQGDAAFFRDGVMIKGKWQRKSEQEFWQFTDSAGSALALKPGVTWFEIVPLGYPLDLK
jgi:hypothetical protein